MHRSVASHLAIDVTEPAMLALLVSVADGAPGLSEELTVSQDGRTLEPTEMVGPHGTRLHQVQAGVGPLTVAYRATVDGQAGTAPVDPLDLVTYLRPSRYVESDAMVGLARAELGGLAGHELLAGVARWVERHVAYVSGSSGPTDGATQTLLSGQGVCRDFAHLTTCLLRAMDVPARLAAVYAPGLSPMDFHAVVEGYVDGGWWVVDATHLAPRRSMLRISTGRDAADTAFLSVHHGRAALRTMEVTAVVDGDLPTEDWSELVPLR